MQVFENYSLKAYNTFGIDANADYFVSVQSLTELREVLSDSNFKNLPHLVLGGGSNILLCSDYKGLVIHIDFRGIKELGNGLVCIQAGENWHEFVMWSLERGYNGLENLSLIPGNVGTAPIQNIGAYGVELKDVFVELQAYHISSGEVHLFDAASCGFDYRDSVFKNVHRGAYIILSVTLQLRNDGIVNTSYGAISDVLAENNISSPSPKDVSDAVISIRSSKLPNPKEIGNSGSFFKNPVLSMSHFEAIQREFSDVPSYPVNDNEVKVPAGWMIEKAGWKGKQFQSYGVHEKQALVLVNYGGATGQDIHELAQQIRASIKEKFGVDLEMEVNVIH